MPRRKPAIALDLGGSKLAAAVVDAEGRVSRTVRAATPHGPRADDEYLWRTVQRLLDRVVGDAAPADFVGVGVGSGGPMTWPDGVVSPLNIPAWREFPLRERLRERFPKLPVRLHNDAVCLTVGEHWRGAGRGAQNVMGISVSAGVGGGLVLGGVLVDGASGNAGHIGHVVVDPDGPPCICGGYGCLESIARGPALTEWAAERKWRRGAGESRTVADLASDASRGHPVALAALERAGSSLGIAIASATHLLDLEVVAIGGALAQAGASFLGQVDVTFRRHARMEYAREVRVVSTDLGQHAALVGAAALVLEGDRYWSAD